MKRRTDKENKEEKGKKGSGSSSREASDAHDGSHTPTHSRSHMEPTGRKRKRMFLAFDCLDNSIRDSVLQWQKRKQKQREGKKLCTVNIEMYMKGLFCYLRFQSHAQLAIRRNINRASE
jgi:hypothetical protein